MSLSYEDFKTLLNLSNRQQKLLERIADALEEMNERAKEEKEGA